jgi:hypothetical protein
VHTGPELVLSYARLRVDCQRIGHPLAQRSHDADRWVAAPAVRPGIPLVSNEASSQASQASSWRPLRGRHLCFSAGSRGPSGCRLTEPRIGCRQHHLPLRLGCTPCPQSSAWMRDRSAGLATPNSPGAPARDEFWGGGTSLPSIPT